ncbi:hypothetical protein GQX74_005100 [Glossina fuscipes]|nr:hypothetical protein GQX74_005100 [Glossina fuscipes]
MKFGGGTPSLCQINHRMRRKVSNQVDGVLNENLSVAVLLNVKGPESFFCKFPGNTYYLRIGIIHHLTYPFMKLSNVRKLTKKPKIIAKNFLTQRNLVESNHFAPMSIGNIIPESIGSIDQSKETPPTMLPQVERSTINPQYQSRKSKSPRICHSNHFEILLTSFHRYNAILEVVVVVVGKS